MRRFERLSEGELDRLLAGRAPDERPELDDIALFARGLRARLAVAPDRDLEARHMAALVRESAEQRLRGGTETGAPARRAPRPALRMALAGLSVFLTTAGLAMAGVPLRPAERLLETLGVSEESGGSEAGERGRVGSPAREPEPRPSGAREGPTGPVEAPPDARRSAGRDGRPAAPGGEGWTDRPAPGRRVAAERRHGAGGAPRAVPDPGGRPDDPGRPGGSPGDSGRPEAPPPAGPPAERGPAEADRGQTGVERGESGADRGQAEAERGAENAEQAPAGPPEGVVPDGPPASAEPGGARSIEGGNPIDRGDRE